MTISLGSAISKINEIFAAYDSAGSPQDLVSQYWKAGKVYEAWVLTHVLGQLKALEGFNVTLVGGTKVHLKSSPGPVNPRYPHFEISRLGGRRFDVWTDIEFATLSYALSGNVGKPGQAHRHELDIAVVKRGASSYPRHEDIVLGVECKNTGFEKAMARAALGVRRELSFLQDDQATIFQSWPRETVPASPPSVLLVCSTDRGVETYNEAGIIFGVDFSYLPMP